MCLVKAKGIKSEGRYRECGVGLMPLDPSIQEDDMYCDHSKTHKCVSCGEILITLFKDRDCTVPHPNQELCVDCSERLPFDPSTGRENMRRIVRGFNAS